MLLKTLVVSDGIKAGSKGWEVISKGIDVVFNSLRQFTMDVSTHVVICLPLQKELTNDPSRARCSQESSDDPSLPVCLLLLPC